ncbi:FAD-binding oxidoreductase [Macrococcus equipercicus]|uniref:FAD-binding oxidoreductase n=1 Tax=Macrococcus equipercicus TaxID=69967 RepID=A0ABQ6R6E4_9STAP|nr:FAD-binding oxidoreductase [Macrococcus equipercicus]KAA1036588.1 FAD-binding oxidoreductase [Macrococcus equipercicus]
MLHNGELFWPKTYYNKHYPALDHDAVCDVLIVGGGMSGAITAFTMARAGYRTIMIDKETIAGESSAANTGLLQFMSDKPLADCIEDFGEEDAYEFYELSFRGMNYIRELCTELPADVEFHDRDSVLYASKKRHDSMLRAEYIALRKFGFPCELLTGTELYNKYGISRSMGLVTHCDGEINPYVFIQRLVEKAVSDYGLKVFERTELLNWRSDGEEVRCDVTRHHITAQHVVYAGGYADNEFVKAIKKKRFVRSFALVSKPLSSNQFWADKAMLWETARPYLYIRHVEGNRILVGGLDDNNRRIPSKRLIRKKSRRLIREFHKLFPTITLEAADCYGARFGETKDGKPFIGEVPDMPNCYMLLGYGGNGTVYSAFGAKLLLEMIRGEENPQHRLFKLER